MDQDESAFIKHLPCDNCGSSNANSLYSDGHTYCFACEKRTSSDGEQQTASKPISTIQGYSEADVRGLSARKISEETCRLFGVRVGQYKDKTVHFYPYYQDNQIVACKVRGADKSFAFLGDAQKPPLFGMNLWSKGKKIIVTEGEIDALTVSQVQGNKWPVVSIPNGAQGAKKSIQKHLEYFEAFEEVILMFDMDEPGQKAAQDCAELFSPGKCKIASLPMKDPNECLLAGKPDAIIQAMWNAKAYRPDGIISGLDLWDEVSKEESVTSVPYPWLGLNEKTHGMRKGELVTLTAGSGIGKSSVVRELTHWLIQQGETVGMLMLEENPKRTALGLMGIDINKPLHLSREGVTEDDLKTAFDKTLGSGRVFLYNHFGSSDIDNLISRVRFLAKGCGCNWIVLDHLSIVVSGLGDGDERRLIDNAMTMLRTLVEETGIGLILVSHLKRPEGKGHEEGAQTSLGQLRGSAAIGQLSDMVIGLERSQQGENPNEMQIRVLKNRFSGATGLAGTLHYNTNTGRLTESPTTEEAYGF